MLKCDVQTIPKRVETGWCCNSAKKEMLMLSKEVDHTTWLRDLRSTSSDTNQVLEIQIETSAKMDSQFLYRIKATVCFRILNPRQRSFLLS